MRQTHKIFGLLALFFLALPLVSADLNDDLRAYWSLDDDNRTSDDPDDLTLNGFDGTGAGTITLGVTGKLNEAFTFSSGGDKVSITGDPVPSPLGTSDWAIAFWIKNSVNNNRIITNRDTSSTGNYLMIDGRAVSGREGIGTFMDSSGSNGYTTSNALDLSDGLWHHIVVMRNNSGSELVIFVDGSPDYIAGTALNPSYSITDTTTTLGYDEGDTANGFQGTLDEIGMWNRTLTQAEVTELYNSGSGLSYYNFSSEPATPTASERHEEEAYLEQTGTTTINGIAYASVLSGDIEILNNTWLYGSATIPITNPQASNTAICQISIDGAELNESETTRSLTAGQNGNVLLTSFEEYVTVGNYTFGLDCKRSGGGAYDVVNSTLYVHKMSTVNGIPLETSQYNVTSKAISGLIDTFNLTTSENQTAVGFTRALVLEWTASYDYTSTQNMSVTTEVAGTNCTPVTRYGASGSLGNVAGVCYRSGLTNSTSYDVKIYGSGTGNIENGVFHLKEFILHTNEINSTDLSGTNMTTDSFVNLANHTITINGAHSTPDLVSEVVISVLSNNGTTTPAFYLSNGTINTSIVSRTVGAGEPGVLGIQAHYEGVTGAVVMSLIGSCPNSNCSISGVEMVSYVTNALPIDENSFEINLTTVYDSGTEVQNFNVKLDDETTFTTTTGTIVLVSPDSLVNITFPADNSTIPPFFPNNTADHDTSTNLSLIGTPWTAVYALEPDSSTVYNYTINYTNTNDSSENGSWTTTSGVAYVPLYNATYNLTITGAVGNDSTNFAIQTQTVNVSQYLENYTFNLLVANSVNITYYDEETGAIIDDRTVILEYFSDTGTSGNDTTTTGVMFVNLLLPELYTFVYDAVGYDQRFFEYTLVNETFNNINLTLLNSSSSSTVTITVKDTLDNRLENAVVKILKFDVAENQYDLLEIRRTNFEGQTIAGMILNDPLYKFIIEYDGSVVLTTTGTQIYGTSLTLVVNLIQESGFEEIFAGYTMSGKVTFDNSTNLFTFTYNDESNTGSSACLRVYRVGSSRTNYNATCSSVTSGSLTLGVANISGRSYQAIGTITDSSGYTHTMDSAWAVFTERIQDDGSSLIMMILMIIIFATALAVSVEIALVGAFAVPVIFTATGLTALSYGVTVPLLIIGVILAFIIGVVKR